MLETVQANLVEQLQGRLAPVGFCHSARFQSDFHVLLHGQPRIQGEGLKHDRRVRVDAALRLALIQHLAVRGRVQPGDHAQQRRFAAARRAEQAHKLAGEDFEAHILHGSEQLGRLAIQA